MVKQAKHRYLLQGYDKDNDMYTLVESFNNYEEALKHGKALLPLLNNDQLTSEQGEPIDWLEIENTETEKIIFLFREGVRPENFNPMAEFLGVDPYELFALEAKNPNHISSLFVDNNIFTVNRYGELLCYNENTPDFPWHGLNKDVFDSICSGSYTVKKISPTE